MRKAILLNNAITCSLCLLGLLNVRKNKGKEHFTIVAHLTSYELTHLLWLREAEIATETRNLGK